MATQTWPEFENAPQKSFDATVFGSTSGSTIAGSLPPSSSVTFFRSSAATFAMALPVGTLPVNEILRTVGCAVIHAPTSLVPPSTLSTPAGTTSFSAAASASDESGVNGDGFATTVLPASSAGPSFWTSVYTGKF